MGRGAVVFLLRVGLVLALLAVACGARASCADGIRNGPESDVDCGGDCLPCEIGRLCSSSRDCASGRCGGGLCEERPYEDGDPIPPGYHVEMSDTDSAAITRRIGLVLLGVGYGGAYVAALSLPGELSWLYVPVVGPWVEVADEDQGRRGLIALDATFQTVGFALLAGGLLARGEKVVRDPPETTVLSRVRVTPTTLGKAGYGLGVTGTF